jgi:hypothetical protein
MNKKELESLIASAVNDAELRSDEIPPIELYVDQIINLHTEKLKEGDARFHDRQITKTMINNYAKDRVITPVKGKKYTKEQIIQILTVYTLKGTLSIGEIKRFLDGAYGIEGFDAASLTALYDKYCDTKEKNRELSAKIVSDMIDSNGLDVENDEDFLVTLASIVSISAFMKNIAQAMIDEKFPPIDEDEKDKKDKDDKKSKEKQKKEKSKKDEKKSKKPEEVVPSIEGMTAWN